jgi:hypothetical protein
VNGVDGSSLTNAIDAPGALFEPHRIPRQLDMNHHATAMMQIEPLGTGVGSQQRPGSTADEGLNRAAPLTPAQSTVQHDAVEG